MIDPTFRNINRLFFISLKNDDNDPTRKYFGKIWWWNSPVEIKYFNALIENKEFSDYLVKKKQEAYIKLIEMPKIDDYTTGRLLDFSNQQN